MADPYEHLRRFPLNVVLAALGFEEFRYRKAGTEGYGACPIHGSRKNMTCFSFNDDGRFNCFSCSAKGRGAIDLVMQIQKVGFKEAVDWLQAMRPAQPTTTRCDHKFIDSDKCLKCGWSPELPQTYRTAPAQVPLAPITENPVFKGTYEKYAVPSPWLSARGLTDATCRHFDVFQYDNPKRRSAYSGSVMLKIRRWCDGKGVGYLIRNIGEITPEKPKYLLPKGICKTLELFGAWQLKEKAPIRVLYVVESPFAVMKFHQHGLPAVSPFGWAVSDQQLDILGSLAKGCCYLPDRNVYAQAEAVAGFLSQRLWVKLPQLPANVDDPEQLDASQIAKLA